MADAFENILGQPQVREFLRASVASERVTHAYLFTGPAGSNKTMAAYALAQALLCPKGPHGPRGGECGACDICRRVKRKKHPDVRYVAPEGAGGYLVDQIRDIAPLLRTLCYFYSMTLQRIENERQLVAMSYHDSLTGLYNRNRYNEDVRRLEKLARPFGAVFLDVNGMKEINDRGGHAEGDHLLQA